MEAESSPATDHQGKRTDDSGGGTDNRQTKNGDVNTSSSSSSGSITRPHCYPSYSLLILVKQVKIFGNIQSMTLQGECAVGSHNRIQRGTACHVTFRASSLWCDDPDGSSRMTSKQRRKRRRTLEKKKREQTMDKNENDKETSTVPPSRPNTTGPSNDKTTKQDENGNSLTSRDLVQLHQQLFLSCRDSTAENCNSNNQNSNNNKGSTSWTPPPPPGRLLALQTRQPVEMNRRGVKLIEGHEILGVYEEEDDEENDINDDQDKEATLRQRFLPNDNDSNNNTANTTTNTTTTNTIIHDKDQRHLVFADWLIQTFGKETLARGSGVLDVAGGNGALSGALRARGIPSILLDPLPRVKEAISTTAANGSRSGSSEEEKANHPENDRSSSNKNHLESTQLPIIPRPLNGNGSDLLFPSSTTTTRTSSPATTEQQQQQQHNDQYAEWIRNCSCIVGMHPDQATEPCVDMALLLHKPFAVIPCCVMPSLFPLRRQRGTKHGGAGDPVRSYKAFCQYLLDKQAEMETMTTTTSDQKPDERTRLSTFRAEYLPFVGRNKVIYATTAAAPASVT